MDSIFFHLLCRAARAHCICSPGAHSMAASWGRLMPVGSNDSDVNPPPGDHGGRPGSARGATEMLPRSPGRAGPIATRRRSPSDSGHSNGWSPPCINFLGLKNLLPSDRFNEYVLGRSVKVSGDVSSMLR